MSERIRRLIEEANKGSTKRPSASPRALEEAEHVTVADWLRAYRILFHHSPNGGIRDRKKDPKSGKTFSVTAIKMKRMGTSNGFLDIIIFDRPPLFPESPGCVIEMKKADSGRGAEDRGASEEQKEWIAHFQARGWKAKVCHGATAAITYLESLGYGRRR